MIKTNEFTKSYAANLENEYIKRKGSELKIENLFKFITLPENKNIEEYESTILTQEQ